MDLIDCEYDASGIVALADALHFNGVLTTLYLSNNNIDWRDENSNDEDDVAIALASALKVNGVLAYLALGDHYGEESPIGQLFLPMLRGTDPVKSIEFSGSYLGSTSAIVIASLIEDNAVLTSLDISRDRIGDEGAIAIANALSANRTLTKLRLAHNNIGPTGATAIAEGEALRFGVLTTLSLDNLSPPYDEAGGDANYIGDGGAAAIAGMLRGNAVLTSLDLSRNHIGPTGATAIAEALHENEVLTELNIDGVQLNPVELRSIESLSLANVNNPGEKLGPASVIVIASLIVSNEMLTFLDVGHNDLMGHTNHADKAALSIVRAERQRNKLIFLGLAYCGIGPTTATEIAEYVSDSGVLTSLDLSNNRISGYQGSGYSAAGITALAEALRGNRVLTKLNLRNCGIDVEGAKAIGSALAVKGVLTHLDLSRNSIGHECHYAYGPGCGIYSDAGITAIAEALRVNGVLTHLDLSRNHIGDRGAVAIADALRDNRVLIELRLAKNYIGPTGATAIAEALRVNRGVLKRLDISDNNIGDVVVMLSLILTLISI